MEYWQDYDCPHTLIDFDLNDEDMVYEGKAFYCSGCEEHHVAGIEVSVGMYGAPRGGMPEETLYFDLPKSAEALAALIANHR